VISGRFNEQIACVNTYRGMSVWVWGRVTVEFHSHRTGACSGRGMWTWWII